MLLPISSKLVRNNNAAPHCRVDAAMVIYSAEIGKGKAERLTGRKG
mgnify:FL=1